MSTEKSNDIGNRTRELAAGSIVPQPTTLPCTPLFNEYKKIISEFILCTNCSVVPSSRIDFCI
jgi:hypothetical protein